MNDFTVGSEGATSNLKENIGKLKQESIEKLKQETVKSASTLASALRQRGTAVLDYAEGHPGRVVMASLAIGLLLGALGKASAGNGKRMRDSG